MAYKRLAILLLCIFVGIHSQAQTCPSNIDFELGNFTNWRLYTGACCPIATPTLSGPVTGRHTLTSGTGVDPEGGFPIVAPSSGSYSLKLGNSRTGAQAERARYYVRVPAGVNNYSIIFRYAVVFEDPGHPTADQPRFEVRAFDSVTNNTISCSQFTYVASSSLPGFFESYPGSGIYCKNWTTASLNLSGSAGKTVVVDFATGDCAQGGHFGYGYVDMNCGLFQIQAVLNCDTSTTVRLSAPPGFQYYSWRDSAAIGTVLDTGQTVNLPKPSGTKTYAVILTPYTGYGCSDTLYTTVRRANLTVSAGNDTSACNASSMQLRATGVGSSLTYNWTPTTGLSCSTCTNPTATFTGTRVYYVTATDANSCSKTDTVKVSLSNITTSTSSQNISCYNAANGVATTAPTNGISPYTYSWNTSPARTTNSITGLGTGKYVVTITDSLGCTRKDSVTITQPTILNASVTSTTPPNCNGGNNGTATVSVNGGTSGYTYSWNTTPAQTTATATGLTAGNYIVTVTDSKGCTDTALAVVTQPAVLTASAGAVTNVSCYGGNNGAASVSVTGGNPTYTYSWNTSPPKTSSAATGLLAGNYIVTVTDSKGCSDTANVSVSQPTAVNASISATTNVNCYGSSTGTATVSTSGGTGSYTYSWNTSPSQSTITATNLAAGTYIVTATDSLGCTDTAKAIITQLPALRASIVSTTKVNCSGINNGVAVATATGGTPSYSYSWNTSPAQNSDTAKNLAAGVYVVTVTDNNGCTDTALATITQLSTLTSNITSSTNVSCYGGNNGAATVGATGGTPSYTYSWNTSPVITTAAATGLTSGTYTVTVTDNNGCKSFSNVAITEPAVLNAFIDSSTDINCYGNSTGMAKVSVIGGTTPYTYSWNTSPVRTTAKITGLTAGNYMITVTDNKGCTDTAAVTLTQPSTALNASISSITNINCNGNSNGSATVVVTGGTSTYTYSWNTSPIQNTATASGVIAGNYIVTVTDSKGCVDTASAIITQPAKLVASVSNVTNVSCNGNNNGAITTNITGGTPSYTFSWNTSPVQTTQNLGGLVAGSYILTVTDNLGCTDTAAANIIQPNVLIATMSATTKVTCYGGNNGTATVGVTGGTTGYTYSWNTTPAQTTATATGLIAGTYIVTVTDARGCSDTALAVITQSAQLTASITSSTDVSCYNGSNGTAAGAATGGTSPYTYSWNTSPVQTAFTATGLRAGSYTVTVTDSLGCTSQANITITQPAALDAVIDSKTNINCYGGSNGAATVSVIGGTSGYTYSWNTTPVRTTTSISGVPAGTYIVTATDSKGCTDTAVAVITQPAALNAAITGLTNITCNGSNNGAATVAVTGGTTAYTYSWSTTPVKTTAAATGLAAGSYNVIVTDSKGCKDTATAIITQPAVLTAAITASSNVSCNNGNNGTATVTPTGGTAPYSISWNTNPVQTTATASGLTAGTYTATITDKNGCVATATATITQPAPFIATATPTKQTCIGTANGEATGGVTGGVAPFTYNWNSSPAQSTIDATGLPAGTYIFTVTDASGCTASASAMVINFPKMDLEITSDQELCENKDVQLEVKGAKTYTWDNASSLSCSTCANPIAHPLSTTTYHVIAVDSNSCVDTASVAVTVITRKDVNKGPDQDVCEGTNVQLHASGGVEYTWSPETFLNDAHIADPVSRATETIKYRVIIKENECFTDTLYQTVNVFPMPTVDLGPDKKSAPGVDVQLNALVKNANKITWSPTDGLSCADCTAPIANVPRTTTYKAEVINDAGCKAEDDITIIVSCDGTLFFVPNTFTPNGDGLNDVFLPSVKGATTISHMAVYNRWGQMIYEARNFPANDTRYGWDGTFNNVELKPDVFVYVIDAMCTNGQPVSVKGDISLIR